MILNPLNHQTRVKVVLMCRDQLVRMLYKHRNTGGTWRLNHPEELPEGTQVLAIHEDLELRCFKALVTHPSFDEVPVGQMPPIHGDLMESWVYLPSQEEKMAGQVSVLKDLWLWVMSQGSTVPSDLADRVLSLLSPQLSTKV